MKRRSLAMLLAPAWLGSCALFGGGGGSTAATPQRHDVCQDGSGAAAWERAQAALAKRDDQAALPELITCTQQCPDFVRAHLAYQDCARRLGGEAEQKMIATYRALPDRGSPVPPYLKARLADTPYAQCNALDQILERHENFAWGHLSRGRVNRQQGRLLPALDMFAQAIRCDANLVEARLERAQTLAELGRDGEAAVEYRAYLAARSEDLRAVREFVSLCLYRLGAYDEATRWLDRLEQAFPGDLSVRMDRAAAFWRAGRLREAVDIYCAVLKQAPGTARAALNLGLLYYEVVPHDEQQRRRYWPLARSAFQLFLASSVPTDGHEQFERTLGVPFRLARIAELLGPASSAAPSIDALRWPEQA